MSVLKWLVDRAGVPLTVMTTELNGLASGSAVLSTVTGSGSGIIPNATAADLYADFLLTVTFGSAPTLGYPVELFIARSLDGTNFDQVVTGASPVAPANGTGDNFLVNAVTTQQLIVIPQVELPPADFKIFVRNSCGQAMAASGNTIKMLPYKRAVV